MIMEIQKKNDRKMNHFINNNQIINFNELI